MRRPGANWSEALLISMLLFAAAPTAVLAQRVANDPRVTAPSIAESTPEDSRPPRGQRVPTSFRLRPYGSNANFNPLSMLVNRGLDMWQLDQYSPSLVDFPYAKSAGSIWHAVTHPKEGIERMGGWEFLTNEVIPGAWHGGNVGWIPNYTLHFFMGGVTYVRTEGWFADRGWPAPKLWAGATTLAAAYITEMTEVGYEPAGAAAFADLLFFDVTGVLAFNIPWVRNLFGEKMRIMDWSLQPVFTPHAEVYNQGDYLAMKMSLPFSDRMDFFWRLGLGTMFGLSIPRAGGDAISFGIGAETTTHHVDDGTLEESVTMGFAGGVFYDRDGSLLAGLEMGMRERMISLNIYPGVFPKPLRDMGVWASLDSDVRPRLGVVFRALGMGLGHSPRGPHEYDLQRAALGNN